MSRSNFEQSPGESGNRAERLPDRGVVSQDSMGIRVGLLTGGDDPHYSHGLAEALANAGVLVEYIGSDALDSPVLRNNRNIQFLNLRGDQSENATYLQKLLRLGRYYLRLLRYSARTRAKILHILWNNKFELFDRTLLMLFYRLCGKQVVITAHNVNVAKRDGYDSWINRRTLSVQYNLCSNIFVHTEKMRAELSEDFSIPTEKVSVIPFGLNDAAPRTGLSGAQARERLGVQPDDLVLLFFGQIAPYKGLHFLVEALPAIYQHVPRVRVVIAGKVKRGSEDYWHTVDAEISQLECHQRVICRIEHIPDEDIEIYFKAADALVVPYVQIFQSGLPFLAYSFGLPVLATDVGSLSELIVAGENGFVCEPCNADALASMIRRYADSELCAQLPGRRAAIAEAAREQHSWGRVARITTSVYEELVK